MKGICVRDMVAAIGGSLISGDPDSVVLPAKISTDSRSVPRGGIFVALKGPNFDGNDFVEDALRSGSAGAIVSRAVGLNGRPDKIIVRTGDTCAALGMLARYHRSRFHIPVAAITGSNGKTTVKEMAALVLSARHSVLKNEGTRNNHIGVPLALLRMDECHSACVLELGTNHAGEIRYLGRIVRPRVALVTNIGPSHLEHFGTLAGVLRAKSEIFDCLEDGGIAIVNGDDEYLKDLRLKRKVLRFGLGRRNDVRADSVRDLPGGISFRLNGKMPVRMAVMGRHNVYNALAAAAIGLAFGVGERSIAVSLGSHRPYPGRLCVKKIDGITVIDDTYNSNPLSMRCAVEALMGFGAPASWIVAADMLELGRSSASHHARLGREIAASGARGLITYGSLSITTHRAALKHGMDRKTTVHCSSHGEAASFILKNAGRGDAVLVKGSRSMKMEKIIERLEAKRRMPKDKD